eukprot:CAMPEP_0204563748 /NCGR_PEP_ID=MMETSP0661-20131031/34499_1 /ASSEMBLY_ACC=CAM_ASM_000606 /TAXON_ID=109239 /ORGANISM="Alexandrium margalefi, Strain AMGDE01CS-322" /LENGTH=36 /DNA_ID= /DNA_START= /DNA_END= /DNA_ORIENTATION=
MPRVRMRNKTGNGNLLRSAGRLEAVKFEKLPEQDPA